MPSDVSPFSGNAQDFDIDRELASGFGRKGTSIDTSERKTTR
jgi:hypothetical protein